MKKIFIPLFLMLLGLTSCNPIQNVINSTSTNSSLTTGIIPTEIPTITPIEDVDISNDNDLALANAFVLQNTSQYFSDYPTPYKVNILNGVDVKIIIGDTVKIENDTVLIQPKIKTDTVVLKFTSTVGVESYTDTVEFTTRIPDTVVTTPQTGVEYNIFLSHTSTNSFYYFAGEKDGYYGKTTSSRFDASTVILEEALNGFYISYKDSSENKMYYNLIYENGYVNFSFSTTPLTIWRWDYNYYTFITTINNVDYFTGCRAKYTNIGSLNTTDYLGLVYNVYLQEKGNSPNNSYPLNTVDKYNWDSDFEENTKYILLNERSLTTYYVSYNYEGKLITTENILDSTFFYVEKYEDGFYLYFYDDDQKKYLTGEEVYSYGSTGSTSTGMNVSCQFFIRDEPVSYWKYDSNINIFFTINKGDYLGPYFYLHSKRDNTLEVSLSSYSEYYPKFLLIKAND